MKTQGALKSLKPSMKERKRYLLLEGQNLQKNIENAIFEFSGVMGMKKASPSFIQLKTGKNTAILAINREALNLVRASLVVWPEKITVRRVSGTLKGLRLKN